MSSDGSEAVVRCPECDGKLASFTFAKAKCADCGHEWRPPS